MRIPGIEPRVLRFQTKRQDSAAFIAQHIRDKSSILIEDETDGLLVSDVLVDVVALSYGLNYVSGLEALRRVRDAALALVKPGGMLVAVARACDNGEELAVRMVSSGVSPDVLGVSNLSSQEIIGLAPQSGVFLTSSITFVPPADDGVARFTQFASDVRRSAKKPDIRFVARDRFTTRIVDVGLTWHKPLKPQR